jgi:hypothetical protein
MMHNIHIIRDGHPFTPLELVLKLGSPTAAIIIGEQIEALIATLDGCDTDADLELNGDEFDGNVAAEDEFVNHIPSASGPGCALADAGEEDGWAQPPKYGVDQSAGPINFNAARKAVRDQGVERAWR